MLVYLFFQNSKITVWIYYQCDFLKLNLWCFQNCFCEQCCNGYKITFQMRAPLYTYIHYFQAESHLNRCLEWWFQILTESLSCFSNDRSLLLWPYRYTLFNSFVHVFDVVISFKKEYTNYVCLTFNLLKMT